MIGAGAVALGALIPAGSIAATTASRKRTLVAAYFGGWKIPVDPSQRYYFGDNPWAGPTQPNYPNVKIRMPDFPERFPLGFPHGYNEAEQRHMDEAIDTASGYGIDVFAMNWYRDEFSNHAVLNFKNADETRKAKMSWFLQWSNNSNSSNANPPSDSREYFFEGIRRAALHMQDSAYWKIEGKPVFAIYDETQILRIINKTRELAGLPQIDDKTKDRVKLDLHDAFLQDCHNIVANVIAGKDHTGGIYGVRHGAMVRKPGYEVSNPPAVNPEERPNTSGIIGDFLPSMHLLIASADIGGWGQCRTVQGMYLYNIRGKNVNGKFQQSANFCEMMADVQAQHDVLIPALKNYRSNGQTWWPTLMAGFDDNAWRAVGDVGQKCLPTAEQFKQHCAQINKAHEGREDVTGGITFIYAWNEFGEGGWIAPTRDVKTSRLEALQQYLKIGDPFSGVKECPKVA